ncbi:MAG: cation diffusion facilitator family transporter [Mariprofundaceae bacterium]
MTTYAQSTLDGDLMSHGSTKAVLTAVAGNSIVTVAKFIGFTFSGSSALLAEAVHSLADTANQALLYLGIRRSMRGADETHHFGYGQERYFWNLVSAVTIFFIGCVYTVMHAIDSLRRDHQPELSQVAFLVIGIAFIVEGYSFMVALKEFNRQRQEKGCSFFAYFRESNDPTTVAVLIEDSVAMVGLVLALLGMAASAYTGSTVFDGVAALAIGVLMGLLAFFLATVNKKYLINAADPAMDSLVSEIWKTDERIQRLQLVNSIVISPEESVLMAELELREEELFADMSEEEVARAVTFMKRQDDIRRALETEVRRVSPQAKHIFIEFVGLPEQKDPE